MNSDMEAYFQAQCQKLQECKQHLRSVKRTLAGYLLLPWLYLRMLSRHLRSRRHLRKRGLK